MSTATAIQAIGRPIDNPENLGRALDDLLATHTEPPALFALGEPTHGIAAFPLLRNDVLGHLVERGYRSIVLETDYFAASIVDDYVCGASTEIDTVLATGFSHGFGAVPGNRELVEWLRAHNAARASEDRVHFHGFDAPVEYAGAPGPRHALARAADCLPDALRPESVGKLDELAGEDADWTNPAAMYDPAASIGNSPRAHALRLLADDLAGALHRASPGLRPADPAAYDRAVSYARTAQGLLRFHAAMATDTPDRIDTVLSVRAEMMADNLLAIVAQEQHRGPSLVFAHNAHLSPAHDDAKSWGNAGALVHMTLADRYLFVATDASPAPDPNTLQHSLAAATPHRSLFPAPPLRAALSPSTGTSTPIVPGHIPLTPADLSGAAAVVFIADTDGKRHQYW
ncbi:erythromycin esterase family protein [Nocardia sp. NPDC051981]|uniref:erythromycin esterase family protein n=1 Tax=Nocardia sp. NPDC051981 TaxID=3155417 RepID=UPI00341E8780